MKKLNVILIFTLTFYNSILTQNLNIVNFGKLTDRHTFSIKNIPNKTNSVYLSIDLCDGKTNNIDTCFFNFIINNKIPALIFVTGKWIKKNLNFFETLTKYDFISIGNHGLKHIVPSIQKNNVFGIDCAKNIKEAEDEIIENNNLIYCYLKKNPKYFRPATLFYDSIAIKTCLNNKLKIITCAISSYDGLFEKRDIKKTANKIINKIKIGDIILFHGNHINWKEGEVFKTLYNMLLKKNIYFDKIE